jgi:hypothetical protein
MGESHRFSTKESTTSTISLIAPNYTVAVMKNASPIKVLTLRSLRRCEKFIEFSIFTKRTQQLTDSKGTPPKNEPEKTQKTPKKPNVSTQEPGREPVSTLDVHKFYLSKNNLPLAAPRCTLMLSNAASLSIPAASSPRQHYSRGRRYGPRLRLPGSVPRPSAGIKSS